MDQLLHLQALSWMPEWKYVQGAWSTKVFNIQPATTTRRHQFAFQAEWQQSCSYSADINSAILQSTTTFRCLECSLTENQSIVAMWSYVVL